MATVNPNGAAQYIAVPEQSNMAPQSGNMSEILVLLASIGLVMFNSAHGAIFWYNRMIDYGLIAAILAAIAGSLIPFVEIPLTVLYTNSVRLKDGFITRYGYLSILIIAIILSAYMGSSSQNTVDEVRGNVDSSWQVKMDQLQLKKQAALAKKEATLALAETKDAKKAVLYASGAETAYTKELIKINQERSMLMLSQPLQQRHGAGIFEISDSVFVLFVSFCFSIFVVMLTRYKIEYIQAVMRIPVVSLKNKLDHDWTTDKSDFQNTKTIVNPIKNLSSLGFLAIGKNGNMTEATATEAQPSPAPATAQPKERFFEYADVTYKELNNGEYTTLEVWDYQKITPLFSQEFERPKHGKFDPITQMRKPENAALLAQFEAAKKASMQSKLNPENCESDGCAPVPATGAHPSQEEGADTAPTRNPQGGGGGDVLSDTAQKDANKGINWDAIKRRLATAENAGIGETIECVYCGAETAKTINTKKHCSSSCRKKYNKLSSTKRGQG